jgi:hypothetical protein
MNNQIFEFFFTFSDFFTSHVFDSKSRYIRRLISFEEIRLITLEDILFEEIRLITLSQHDDLRE